MCGILGIISKKPVSDAIYHGLIELQHRGQDAAGIYSYDPLTDTYALHKNKGLVNQVFSQDTIPLKNASWGIGHVRYTTAGLSKVEDTQPQFHSGNQNIAIVQNGNVINYTSMQHELEQAGSIIETGCDAEVILKVLSMYLPKGECSFDAICKAVEEVYAKMPGAYSIIGIINGVGMFAFRDPQGIRPLLHGYRPDIRTHGFASETCALSFFGFVDIYSVTPGEVVFVDQRQNVYRKTIRTQKHAHCSFEFVYFGKPHTFMENQEVYQVRRRLGRTLAKKIQEAKITADVVVPIPDSARPAAISLAHYLGMPYEEGFVKKDHVGRTFLMPSQRLREKALSRKLGEIHSVFRGKRVILVDDSVVRGTVSRKVVQLARRAGATKVYFACSFPPIRFPCFYGVDFPSQNQLLGFNKSSEQIASEIDADDIIYNDLEGLKEAIGLDDICSACITGKYPISCNEMCQLKNLRTKEQEAIESSCLKG